MIRARLETLTGMVTARAPPSNSLYCPLDNPLPRAHQQAQRGTNRHQESPRDTKSHREALRGTVKH